MRIILILIVIPAVIFSSCCDCDVSPVNNSNISCSVREASLTEFNGVLVNDNGVLRPGTAYSPQNFVFPQSTNTAGTIVLDERFTVAGDMITASVKYSINGNYRLAILNDPPINPDMMGDMMLISVDTSDTSAVIKLKGEIIEIAVLQMLDNAEMLCDFYLSSKDFINSKKDALSLYGSRLNDSFNPVIYNQSDIRVLNDKGEDVTGQAGTPPITADAAAKLLQKANNQNIALKIIPGLVYLYKSISGEYFIFMLLDSGLGAFPPHKGRMSFMFHKID
ncbi:MAG: hypothetical protein WC313_09995 [Candidatus Kapaibacterium sp.]